MKKNLLSLATAILCFNSLIIAQNIDVKWGKEVKSEKLTAVGSVIGSDANGYFITKSTVGSLFSTSKGSVARHNYEHEVEYSIDVPNEIYKKSAPREGIYKIKDKIYVFNSQLDKKADANNLYLTVLDNSGNSSEPKLIDEIFYKGKKNKGNFDIHYISESHKFLITHNEGYSKKGNEQVNYKLYDEDFKLLWEKPIELPYKDSKFTVNDYQVDEESNVFMFGEIPVSKDIVKKVVFAYYPATNKLEEAKVEFGKAFKISDLNFKYINGQLQFTGFYFDKKGGIQGVFLTRLNPKTLEAELEKTVPFSKKDLLLFTSERAAKKGKGIQMNYDVRQILVKDNGDFFIVSEAFEILVTSYTDPRTGITRTTYTYYYNDIMVVSLSKNAELNWVQKVPKRQMSVNDGGYYSSYVFTHDNDNLYMIFNDHPKNLSPKTKPEKKGKYVAATRNPKKLMVTLATVNKKTGDYSSELFFKSKSDGKSVFVPKIHRTLNDKQTLIYAEKGKTHRFGIISVN